VGNRKAGEEKKRKKSEKKRKESEMKKGAAKKEETERTTPPASQAQSTQIWSKIDIRVLRRGKSRTPWQCTSHVLKKKVLGDLKKHPRWPHVVYRSSSRCAHSDLVRESAQKEAFALRNRKRMPFF